MDDRELDALPEAYAAALRLRREGASHYAIARALAISPESVGTLIALAESKLAHLRKAKRPVDGPPA